MPIVNCTEDDVSVEIRKPGNAKPYLPGPTYLLGTATGVGIGTLLCGLANGHPMTAALGGLIAAAGVAWTLARHRRPTSLASRPSTAAGRSAGVQSLTGSKIPIGGNETLDDPADFSGSEVTICKDEDGSLIAMIYFTHNPIDIYYDPSGPATQLPLTSINLTNVRIDVLPNGGAYQIALT